MKTWPNGIAAISVATNTWVHERGERFDFDLFAGLCSLVRSTILLFFYT